MAENPIARLIRRFLRIDQLAYFNLPENGLGEAINQAVGTEWSVAFAFEAEGAHWLGLVARDERLTLFSVAPRKEGEDAEAVIETRFLSTPIGGAYAELRNWNDERRWYYLQLRYRHPALPNNEVLLSQEDVWEGWEELRRLFREWSTTPPPH